MSLLKVVGLSKTNLKGGGITKVDFEQSALKKIAIAGETGSGKSTFLKLVAGLIQPDEGTILFEGKKVIGPDFKLIPGCKGIAYLSQYFELPHYLTVEQVLIYANPLSDSEAENDSTAKELYELCDIVHLLKRRTDELSGGEAQRVAFVKALIGQPKLLLLDEPFSNLDWAHKSILKELIERVCNKLGISCLLVSHDPIDTISWADEIWVMKEGRFIEQGNPTSIFYHPSNLYVAGLFGKYTLLKNEKARLFSSVININTSEASLFIRPNAFKLIDDPTKGVSGIVKKCILLGYIYELEVELMNDCSVLVVSPQEITVGIEVYLSINESLVEWLN